MSKEPITNVIDEGINLEGSYIAIWRFDDLIFIADEEQWKMKSYSNDTIFDVLDILEDLADCIKIDEMYEIERTMAYNDPEILRSLAKDVHDGFEY